MHLFISIQCHLIVLTCNISVYSKVETLIDVVLAKHKIDVVVQQKIYLTSTTVKNNKIFPTKLVSMFTLHYKNWSDTCKGKMTSLIGSLNSSLYRHIFVRKCQYSFFVNHWRWKNSINLKSHLEFNAKLKVNPSSKLSLSFGHIAWHLDRSN